MGEPDQGRRACLPCQQHIPTLEPAPPRRRRRWVPGGCEARLDGSQVCEPRLCRPSLVLRLQGQELLSATKAVCRVRASTCSGARPPVQCKLQGEECVGSGRGRKCCSTRGLGCRSRCRVCHGQRADPACEHQGTHTRQQNNPCTQLQGTPSTAAPRPSRTYCSSKPGREPGAAQVETAASWPWRCSQRYSPTAP